MTYSEPARTAPRYVRRRALLVAVLALLAATAFAAPRHLLTDQDRSSLVSDDARSAVLGGQQRTHSVAKVMTAYVVLKHYPLLADDGGPRFVVGQDDAVDTETRRGDGQSVVDVRAGEQLTEREALVAILLPSANNIAVLVAQVVAKDETLADIMATRTSWLPVAGQVTNTITLQRPSNLSTA